MPTARRHAGHTEKIPFLTMLHENMGQEVAVSQTLLTPHYHRIETEHLNEIKTQTVYLKL